MSNIRHNGGLPEVVSEAGFSNVKYFESNVTSTATTLGISPPARRVVVRNRSGTQDVYLRLDGEVATTAVGLPPSDNIKISPGSTFTMDFDSISTVSLVSSGTVFIEGLLGFKGC